MAGGKQIGGDADCAVFAGAVGGGDCGGGEKHIGTGHLKEITISTQQYQ